MTKDAAPGHTPGEWRYARWDNQPHYLVEVNLPCINGLAAWFSLAHVFIPDEAEIGYTDGAHNESAAEANARLIAAAPDLLEALLAVRADDDVCSLDGIPPLPMRIREMVDAAIAKATGQEG